MIRYPETELILTPGKRVYHLNLKGDEIADDVILVGDPGRVKKVSAFFDSIEFSTAHREFISETGRYNGRRITVISTGIGTDNIDIVLNELDAAVNIDPVTRELNQTRRSLNIYRVGTSGSLQGDIPLNSFVTSTYGLGLDGLMNYYEGLDSINEEKVSSSFITHMNWPSNLAYPYCVKATERLYKKFEPEYSGITATAPGFYGPQGREIRLQCAIPKLNEMLTAFRHENLRIVNFEMETSALYGLARLLGHHCLTVCVIIANRITGEFAANYEESVEKLIAYCLNKITS